MRKLYLVLFLVFIGISGKVFAEGKGMQDVPSVEINPPIMTDSVRGLIGNIMTLLKVGPEPETGAVLNAHQEEVGALQDGDESYRVDEGTGTRDDSELKISAYEYMEDEVFADSKWTPYVPLNKKLTAKADMKQVVKDMFFIQDESDNTDEKQKEIMSNRNAYLTAVGKKYTDLAYNIQQRIIDDMSAVSANINGNGSIGAVSGMDQTWKAVNRALIADIGMQIQLMELDAAKFLSVQPVMIMTEERPQDSES